MTVIWTEFDIARYGAEIEGLRKIGVRWCTLVNRYKDILPSADEGELKRLLCLYEASKKE